MMLDWLFRRRQPAPPVDGLKLALEHLYVYSPMLEVRAIQPNSKRPGLNGRLVAKYLTTPEQVTEAIQAYQATHAHPGSIIELRLVCSLRARVQPHPAPEVDLDALSDAAEAEMQTVTRYRDTARGDGGAPPLDSAAIGRAIEDRNRTNEAAQRMAGYAPGHQCDRLGKLVDNGGGVYVRTCSACGAPEVRP
jgi:hypothetical protein